MKLLFLVATLIFTCGPLRAQSFAENLAQGDVFDRKFQPAKALACYLPAEKQNPRDVALLLRIARQYRHLMTDASDPDEKRRLGNLALAYANRAVAAAPKNSEAQLSVAITYGKMMPLFHGRQKVDASRKIKKQAEMAISLDPQNDLAWHVLGRWNFGRANVSAVEAALGSLFYGKLLPGSFEEARKDFERAIQINPNRLMHYIELGRTYASLGKPKKARGLILKGLAMPNVKKDDAEAKRRGRETLAELPDAP